MAIRNADRPLFRARCLRRIDFHAERQIPLTTTKTTAPKENSAERLARPG
jgi:hypothetical protein